MMKAGVGNNRMTTRAAGLRVQSSVYGTVVSVIYGRTRVPAKLIWANDFAALKIKTSKKAGGKKGAGNSYTYSAAADFLLGHAPLRYIGWMWVNKDIYAVAWAYQEHVVSNGQVTISVPTGNAADLIAVSAAVLKEDFSAQFDDFGGDGPVTLAGQWSRPLWNEHLSLPGTCVPGAPAANPYTFSWSPGSGATVGFSSDQPHALDGRTVGIFFCYQNAQNRYPLPHFNLEFEPLLASGSEYTNHPEQRIDYNWVSGVGSSRFDLGSSDMFPSMNFEVGGACELWSNGDCDPADIITDIIMSGPRYINRPGDGWQLVTIGHGLNLNTYSATTPLGNFLGDLTAMRNYCRAYMITCALHMDSQKAAKEWLEELFDVANCAAVWSGSQLKAIPYCEVSNAGNGAVYVAPTAGGPVADLDDSCFLASGNEPPVSIDRTRQAEADNVLPLEHLDRGRQYNTTVTTEIEQRSVHQYGPRKAEARQMHSIHQVEVAQKVASVLVKRLAMQRNIYKFKLPVTYCWLEAMDLVTLTDPLLGLNKLPVRLTAVKESWDDRKGWELACEAEKFIYGLNCPTPMEQQGTNPYVMKGNTDPGTMNPPFIFEACDRLGGPGYNLWMGLSGASAEWGGCVVWMSVDGTNYIEEGALFGKSVMGILANGLAAGADPDDTNTLVVDLTDSLGSLSSVSAADRDAWRSLCWVDGELIGFQTATLTGSNQYSLNHLRRGVFGTPITAHAQGAPFLFLEGPIFEFAADPSLVGKTICFKFTPFNTQGGGSHTLDEETAYSYTVGGRYYNFQQIIANDAQITSSYWDGGGNPSAAGIYLQYHGPGGNWSDMHFLKADGNTMTLPGGEWGPSGGHTFQAATEYWVLVNPGTMSLYYTTNAGEVVRAVYNGHIALGSAITPNPDGTGGSGQPGGPDPGGGGGGWGGVGDKPLELEMTP